MSLFGAYKEPDDAVQDSVVLVGVQDQPQDPTGFALAQKGDVLYFRWDAIEAADVAGFEMRVGASWAAGVPIVQKFSGTEWSTVNFAPGEQQYMLKAINTAGNYSNNPAVIVADIDPRINQNILVSREEHQEGWDGTKSHFTADADGNLQQDTGQATAVYTTPVVDAGDVVRTRFSVRIVQEQSDLSLTWAGATFTWDSEEAQNRTWEGPLGETHITVTIEYRTSDDNVNWRAWQPYVVKEETFRYFQSRATVVSDDAATYVLKLLEYETILDVHDVMEHDENLVVIAAGQDIVFANTFHKEPAVTPAIHGALIGDRFVLTKNGVVGFHLRCYDNNDVAVERTVDWIARGF